MYHYNTQDLTVGDITLTPGQLRILAYLQRGGDVVWQGGHRVTMERCGEKARMAHLTTVATLATLGLVTVRHATAGALQFGLNGRRCHPAYAWRFARK